MAETEAPKESPEAKTDAEQAPNTDLERGTYEIIRNRLDQRGKELRLRLDKLNQARKEVFGSIETALLATERVTTDNNCVPRDMAPVGDRFLFGYNVHIGLRSVTNVADVFAVYAYADRAFRKEPLDLIDDERFFRDFQELYKYYKKTTFAKFAIRGPHLFMIFRVGKDARDIKAFKWLIQEDDTLSYIDARSEHEFHFPPQHEFEWIRTHRDMHYNGPHPHISIADRVFVETVGGDLTIKIENNTKTGEGVYSEDVDHQDQTLDDGEIFYAIVGDLILLKILPYQEEDYRYIVYSEKTQTACRLDALRHACVLLPDDHGLIFSNGYVLQTGEHKIFESNLTNMVFERCIQSANGEDYLYVFYNRLSGVYILLPYNLIEKKVDTPIVCNGKSFFKNGEMIYFKCEEEPRRHHAIQIWQTPYYDSEHEPQTQTDSLLYKIGNRDLVRGMAECHEVLSLIAKEDTYANLFVDLAKKVRDLLDAYYWIGDPDCFDPREPLETIGEAADAAVAEYDKVVQIRRATADELQRVGDATLAAINSIHARRFEVITDFVTSLSDLRVLRGEIITLRDLRYINAPQVDALEKEVEENVDRVSRSCVTFLLRDESLQPYERAIEEQQSRVDKLETVSELKKLEEEVSTSANELEMLIDIVGNLRIDDATQRTAIVDGISTVFSRINQVRAALKNRTQDLMRVEGVAEFASQIKLLNQGVVNYLDVCDSPEKCEDYLTRMMIQIEELEGRFAEFDEFIVELAEKREEVYNAFEARKLQLAEARNKRVSALARSADRILRGIQTRVDSLDSLSDIHGYFASDLMIEKVRDIVKNLGELGDSVKVDDIQNRLKTIREDASRQLKDRQDLYEDGRDIIRFGARKFSVNNQTLDLTIVPRDGEMFFHLSGTAFFERITDADFLATREVWDQEVVSSNREVYRAEFLAYRIFTSLATQPAAEAERLRAMEEEERVAFVQQFMAPRYDEGYVKGVHDHDAARILHGLLDQAATIGLLRYDPRARALARIFWLQFQDLPQKEIITSRLKGLGDVRKLFPETKPQENALQDLRDLIGEFVQASAFETSFPKELLVEQAAEYLLEELTREGEPVVSARARDLHKAFRAHLDQKFSAEPFHVSLQNVRHHPLSAFLLARDWVAAFVAQRDDNLERDYIDEVAALLIEETNGAEEPRPFASDRVIEASVIRDLTGMLGNHSLIQKKNYRLNYNAFMQKLQRYDRETVPRFAAYMRLKKELVEKRREEMRFEEFRPRVLTSFVRNKLIDTVYLPLVGENLAKQIGVSGEQKRTDHMGLLLLVSPPGYGKTTLMEYVANRLGIIFMKVNGPALGHQVTSLDPAEAPNAAAREEMVKLNLAFEMGDNVMIYVDDIQHCNPEFLQKFISLCDAQRKIEGVYGGRTRTYDLRGKKVAVVMAGNPYTESGEKFRIPDMLANRADTYNLGDILGGTEEAFLLSYIENALTSNPALDKLAARAPGDAHGIVRMAQGDERDGVDLEGNYSLDEISEMVAVMAKLIHVRDVIFRVNTEYIRSAAMSDEYRVEPPFQLQGSYRNMNRIAEKIVAIMNDEELESLILTNYESDAQTLATGAESNMLKFKELTERLTPEETERWESIQKTYRRNVQLHGLGDDAKFGQMMAQINSVGDGLETIGKALDGGLSRLTPSAKEEELSAAEGPREIHVVTKVPKSVLGVMQKQFELMEAWIKPTFEQTRRQGRDIKKVEKFLLETQDKYRVLIDKLQDAVEKENDK